MEEFKPVVFKLGDQKFGVDISKIQAIEKDQNIVPVPNTVEYITGIMNLRGEVIPVYSLRKKFHIQEKSGNDTQYIVTWLRGEAVALEVDGVEEIHDVGEGTMHDAPSIIGTGDTGYIDRIISDGNSLIIIINIDALLTEDELSRVGNMVKSTR